MTSQLSLFDAQPDFDASIRRTTENGTVYFSLVDIMAQFSDLESKPKVLWQRTKKRLQESGFDGYQNVIRIKMKDTIGRMQATDCADGQTCLRIVQSIPSPKAEPIRQWLAQLGYERFEETLNPELGIQRAKERARQTYARQGKDAQWISARMEGMVHRNQLTEALKDAVVDAVQYGKATNAEYKGMFHKTAKEITEITGFRNARDGMTPEALGLLTAAESTMSRFIGDREQLHFKEALQIIAAVAEMYRVSVERVQAALGIDLATNRPLLEAKS